MCRSEACDAQARTQQKKLLSSKEMLTSIKSKGTWPQGWQTANTARFCSRKRFHSLSKFPTLTSFPNSTPLKIELFPLLIRSPPCFKRYRCPRRPSMVTSAPLPSETPNRRVAPPGPMTLPSLEYIHQRYRTGRAEGNRKRWSAQRVTGGKELRTTEKNKTSECGARAAAAPV